MGYVISHSTYLCGNGTDDSYDIAVDASGCAYVTGYTESSDFPTVNPYQTFQDYYDVFVTKLSSSGNSLIYSTFLGGDGEDCGYGIALDTSGCAYITGFTESSGFPTENPYQATNQSNGDAFVTKLSNSGNSLVYSTYLGGNDYDQGMAIAVDVSGIAFVAGYTSSSDFPTLNPYQTYLYEEVFVTKLSSSGNNLIYSTYLGGNNEDTPEDIVVDASGCAIVTGAALSSDFPTVNSLQTFQGMFDAFVTKFNSTGNDLIYSTYLGENDYDNGYGIALDTSGCVYITGSSGSGPPTYWADAFVTKICDEGQSCDLGFRPNPDGWQFGNTEGNMWPESWWQQFNYCQSPYPSEWCPSESSDFPDWPLFVLVFGEDQCYYDPPPG